MNERIKALYKQATGKKSANDFDARVLEAERFAQLIVRECAERLLNDAKLTDIQTARCVASIREHFSVDKD